MLTLPDADIEDTRETMGVITELLSMVAKDYAEGALDAAEEAMACGLNNKTAAEMLQNIKKYDMLQAKASTTVDASILSMNLSLAVEQTSDETLNEMNANAKIKDLEAHVVSALLEGAFARIKFATTMLPSPIIKTARCGTIHKKAEDEQ